MGEPVKNPCVVLVPSPGMGHLIPLVQFAKQLVFNHGVSVMFIIPTHASPSKAQETLLNSLPESINYTFLPPVSFDDLPPESIKIETIISLTVIRSLSSLRDALKNMVKSVHVVALVSDPFGADTIDVAKEFHLPSYLFFSTSALALSVVLAMPKLDKDYSCEYRDLPEPIRLPGCIAVHGADFPDPFQDRGNGAYKWCIHLANKYSSADGILVNSFIDLEPGCFKALMEEKLGGPRIFPVGPLIQTSIINWEKEGNECIRWLDDQPQDSVLFISFGSGGTLSSEQLTELALGLEMSEQRFLWVVRSPNEEAANATFFDAQIDKNPFGFLPKGFLERTKGFGLLVLSWAPQIQILSHHSTGGFLTHCGWNSILESIVHGVPLIAWPLFAEQKLNAVMLHTMKMALRPKCGENGIFCGEEINKVVRGLMVGEEGKQLRNHMNDLKSAAAKASSPDGSSTISLCEVIQNLITNKM